MKLHSQPNSTIDFNSYCIKNVYSYSLEASDGFTRIHSDSTGVCVMAEVGSEGRRRMYKAGPSNGINDTGRSQEPLSNLHIGLALHIFYIV
jgi:hypothetical protein